MNTTIQPIAANAHPGNGLVQLEQRIGEFYAESGINPETRNGEIGTAAAEIFTEFHSAARGNFIFYKVGEGDMLVAGTASAYLNAMLSNGRIFHGAKTVSNLDRRHTHGFQELVTLAKQAAVPVKSEAYERMLEKLYG